MAEEKMAQGNFVQSGDDITCPNVSVKFGAQKLRPLGLAAAFNFCLSLGYFNYNGAAFGRGFMRNEHCCPVLCAV